VTAAITSWRSGEAGLATGGGGSTVMLADLSSITLPAGPAGPLC